MHKLKPVTKQYRDKSLQLNVPVIMLAIITASIHLVPFRSLFYIE
uniref:Uncharacterized protein n=1 Tax=Mus musculus TaxID=10090 RepID=Q3TZV0_MOUSE|nr:unnamed protein product [Mus musculus]